MLSRRKKIFVMVGMVALLVVTGCMSLFLNEQAQTTVDSTTTETYESLFVTYRSDRDATREQTMLYLDSIIADESATEDVIAEAQAQKLEIISYMELELTLEGLIKALGFDDAFITASTENVYVVVQSDDLTTDQANQILAIVIEETGKSAQNIIIQPVST